VRASRVRLRPLLSRRRFRRRRRDFFERFPKIGVGWVLDPEAGGCAVHFFAPRVCGVGKEEKPSWWWRTRLELRHRVWVAPGHLHYLSTILVENAPSPPKSQPLIGGPWSRPSRTISAASQSRPQRTLEGSCCFRCVSTIPSRSLCRDDASRRYRPKLLFLLWASLASVEAGIRSSQFGAEQEDLTCIGRCRPYCATPLRLAVRSVPHDGVTGWGRLSPQVEVSRASGRILCIGQSSSAAPPAPRALRQPLNSFAPSRLNWTIVRPTVWTNGPGSGAYRVLLNARDWRSGSISRP
jgi:hypothetical protein